MARVRETSEEAKMIQFTLTDEHVALLKLMCVGWSDDAYYGAPVIDIKRPYANGSVWEDVAEAIGIEATEDDNGEPHWPKGTRERCLALHREMDTALQVCLRAQTFEPGEYVSDPYLDNWRKASA
jgi:hypothetical protein